MVRRDLLPFGNEPFIFPHPLSVAAPPSLIPSGVKRLFYLTSSYGYQVVLTLIRGSLVLVYVHASDVSICESVAYNIVNCRGASTLHSDDPAPAFFREV